MNNGGYVLSRTCTHRKNQKLKIPNTIFENVVNFKYLGMTAIYQNLIHEEIKSSL
jgi:hypothetical protein